MPRNLAKLDGIPIELRGSIECLKVTQREPFALNYLRYHVQRGSLWVFGKADDA